MSLDAFMFTREDVTLGGSNSCYEIRPRMRSRESDVW